MSIKVPPAQARSDKMNTNTQHMKGVEVVAAVISVFHSGSKAPWWAWSVWWIDDFSPSTG